MCHLNNLGWLNKLNKIIYEFSKINGLMPIIYDFKTSRFSSSWSSLMYSTIFSLIVIVLMLCFEIKVFESFVDNAELFHFEEIFASIEIVFMFLKTFFVYTTQIFNQQKMVHILNNGIFLIKEISKLIDDGDQFIDLECQKQIVIRTLIVIIQFISIVSVFSVTYFIYTPFELWILIGYTHVSTVLITGVFYFSGMVVSGRLYRILHQTLKESFCLIKKTQKLNENHLDDVSDRIGRISHKYQKVTHFTNNFNSLFGIQILLTLISCYVVVLNSVSCIRFIVT